MQHKIKLLNKEENWHRLRNYKPNDTVNHNNKLWQNVTGLNSEPNDTSNDWVDINLGVSEKDLESKLDKPTEFATENSHSYVVVIDDAGGSAKRNATDFGKVRSVNGKEGDVILKTSDLENDSDYTTNATLTAHTSNKANPHNVTKEQIGLWNVDNTSDLNKPISTATQTELNKTGNLPSLTTANKNNLVDAINEVNNIQIGGRNLVLNSKRFINDKGIWVGDFDLSEKLEIGKKYSIAINIGLQNQDSILYINNQTGGTLSLLNNLGGNLHQATFIATENIDKILLFQSMNENWFDFMQMKLEKGNKATDWTPAPEGQVSDWNETDSTKFSFIKNKPTIPTVNNGQLTLSTGTGLSGSANFTANQAEESTFSVSVANTHKLPNTAEWDDTLKKDESNIVTDDFSMLQENGAYVSIASNGLKVGFGGITATYGNSNISVDNLVPDAAYQFQELLFPKRAVKNVEEKVYPVTYIQGVKADETGRVDISGVAWNYTNPSIRYSGILDKSADATYNQLLGVDSNGYAAKVNGKVIFQNLPDFLTEAEKTAWKTKMNGGFTTQAMSVFAISPLVLPKSDEVNYMVLSGANLNLNPTNFKIEIISALSQNVIALIPNNQVNLINSSSLNFYYNFKDLPEAEYKIRISNGLAMYIAPLSFYIKENIEYINLSLNTWETWKHDVDSVIVTETPQILQTSNTLESLEYYGKVVNTKLSKILFEASDNFVLTYMVVQSANTNANPILKIGLTDLSDVNNLDNNIIQVITRFSGPQLQNSINGSSISTNNNSPATVTIIKDRNKITQIIATSVATSVASTVINLISPIRVKVLFYGIAEPDATSKIQFQSAYKF